MACIWCDAVLLTTISSALRRAAAWQKRVQLRCGLAIGASPIFRVHTQATMAFCRGNRSVPEGGIANSRAGAQRDRKPMELSIAETRRCCRARAAGSARPARSPSRGKASTSRSWRAARRAGAQRGRNPQGGVSVTAVAGDITTTRARGGARRVPGAGHPDEQRRRPAAGRIPHLDARGLDLGARHHDALHIEMMRLTVEA